MQHALRFGVEHIMTPISGCEIFPTCITFVVFAPKFLSHCIFIYLVPLIWGNNVDVLQIFFILTLQVVQVHKLLCFCALKIWDLLLNIKLLYNYTPMLTAPVMTAIYLGIHISLRSTNLSSFTSVWYKVNFSYCRFWCEFGYDHNYLHMLYTFAAIGPESESISSEGLMTELRNDSTNYKVCSSFSALSGHSDDDLWNENAMIQVIKSEYSSPIKIPNDKSNVIEILSFSPLLLHSYICNSHFQYPILIDFYKILIIRITYVNSIRFAKILISDAIHQYFIIMFCYFSLINKLKYLHLIMI